jgi:hypothetical protein
MTGPLHIGFIPLVDAAALIVAVDKGFAAAEGLDVTLVREVSWSNVRDKLNIGLFDAAHLLAPVAIASSLGLGHVKVPIVAPFNLGLNGNAITVSPALHAAIMSEIDGDPLDPMATALALSRVVAARRKNGAEPLIFGMTFPFSTHNYQLRFWMAAGGVDPDEDVRLVVLPPPYMVDSLANGQVDAFCVGAPWNSIAVDRGVGFILHFVSDILVRAAEKVLAVRRRIPRSLPRLSAPPFARPNSSSTIAPRPRTFWPSRSTSGSMPILSCEPSRAASRSLLTAPCAKATDICWWAGKVPRVRIRCRRHGSTRKWSAGDRHRSAQRPWRSPRRCSGRTSTMPSWVFRNIPASAGLTSWGRSRVPPSMRRMSPDIWPLYGSLVDTHEWPV